MSLSWKPIHKRDLYCAPACGRGCTYIEYRKAKDDGKRVKALLANPQGWKIRVFENLGWHVNLEKSGLQLWWHNYGRGEEFNLLWNTTPYDVRHFQDPNRAITHWQKAVQSYMQWCSKLVAKARA